MSLPAEICEFFIDTLKRHFEDLMLMNAVKEEVIGDRYSGSGSVWGFVLGL